MKSSSAAAAAHEGADIEKGSPASRGAEEDLAMLEPLPAEKEMSVAFLRVCCWVPRMLGPPSTLTSLKSIAAMPSKKKLGVAEAAAKEDMRQVLFSVTGSCAPGQLLALMGPSGSGKTTLLSILGSRAPKAAKTDGAITFNGAPISKRAKRQIGFVLQDDLLYETLTVHETLYFAAMLRLPSHMTKAQKLERVGTVIKALGLTRCKDTIIGGFFRRGVSGGERKRVSVGHELLINPSVLLLDEPTSGLDSTTARNLLQLLRGLASSGRSIITTIHQPSSRIYQQLDSVLLLSQGHPIYYGQGSAAADWFGQLGVECPFGVNVADFILDIASGEVEISGGDMNGEDARSHLIDFSEAFLAKQPQGYLQHQKLEVPLRSSGESAAGGNGRAGEAAEISSTEEGEDASPGPLSSEQHGSAGAALASDAQHAQQGSRRNKLTRSNTSFDVGRTGASRWGATYWTQLQVLFIRAVRVRRFETMSKQDFAQFIVVGLICGLIWWQVGQRDTVGAAQNTVGLLFFESLFLAFRVMFTALFTFPAEFKMMLKERASGMYRLSAFYLARTASDLPMDCSIPSVFIVIIYLMGGLRHGGYFFANWSAIMLCSLVAQSLGLFIGATVMVPKTAQTLASVLMLGSMLVGGFYVRSIPSWISWLRWLSFITYGYSLLIKIEFAGRGLWNCTGGDTDPPSPESDPSCAWDTDLKEALNLTINPNSPVWEVGALFGFLILFRFLVYLALRRKTASR